ncbi:hypothetical protein [Streptomyces pristinaespiralis]|uniref:hypothetical protein n=1 Tax=Streptomyces pristinaespiralis TaxID=38300 RepID=UPI002174EA85|nr:hypothetical protein [Streptomyces pristinaespiralis]
MLTHLASTLGCVTSPAARLLALQCALRADRHGCARLPAGLLRGMRLHRHTEAWQELAQDRWLDLPDPRAAPLQVRLLDGALNQAPCRSARRRAAHWALKPAPLIVPAAAKPADRLAALVLAAHTTAAGPVADMAVVARLCGHSPSRPKRCSTGWSPAAPWQPGTISAIPARCTGSQLPFTGPSPAPGGRLRTDRRLVQSACRLSVMRRRRTQVTSVLSP